jgi:Chalcone isomerase-like
MLRTLILTLIISFSAFSASANLGTEYINKYIPNAQIVGSGSLKFLFWNVYKASLYAPNASYNAGKPIALQLEYLMDLEGDDIADRSITEMKKQGYNNNTKLSAWENEMKKIFPNVQNGLVLTGILTDKGTTVFFKNGKKIGEVFDKEFGKRFFDIWLSEKTSEPKLRSLLTGKNE